MASPYEREIKITSDCAIITIIVFSIHHGLAVDLKRLFIPEEAVLVMPPHNASRRTVEAMSCSPAFQSPHSLLGTGAAYAFRQHRKRCCFLGKSYIHQTSIWCGRYFTV